MALTDLTRISTSGIATGTSLSGAILHGDAHFRGTQVGVTSALFDSSDNALEFNDNVKLTFGNNGDLKIYHDTSNGSYIQDVGHGQLRFLSNDYVFYNAAGNENLVRITENIGVSLYDGTNTVRLATNDHGVVITGILTATSFSGGGGINAGVVTCTGLDVNGNGDISGNLVLGGDLTVNGTTTTLDTNLIGVDRIEVGANSNTIVGVAITQSGSADLVRLYDGASQVVTVDDIGQVGIGTDVPNAILHVEKDGTSQVLARFESNMGTNNNRALSLISPTSDSSSLPFTFVTGNSIQFKCDTHVVTIDDDANVGIGTDNPHMPLHLSCAVQNAVKWQSSDSDGPLTHYYNGSTHLGNLGNSKGVMSSSNLHFGIGSKSDLLFGTKPSGGGSTLERLRIKSDGHIEQTVGADNIGFDQVAASNHYITNVVNANRSSANDHLFIQQGQWNGKDVAAIKLRAGTDTTNKDDGYITFETSSANNQTERLRITPGGNIGIGTATVRNNRTVQISGASQSNLLITGNAPSICLNPDADDSTDNDRTFLGQAIGSNNFANGTTAGDTVLRGNSSGRIVFGIGTNVKMHLTSAGDLNIGSVGRFDANGLVKSAHGTESAPSHTFLNDPDNGMYRPTTNTLGFVTGGAEKLRITSGGSVGIGLTNPEVFHAQARTLVLQEDGHCGLTIDATSSTNSSIFFADGADGSEAYRGYVQYTHSDGTNSDYLTFGTSGDEKVRITSAGHVNIAGGVNPSSGGGKLNVKPSSADSYFKIRNAADFDGTLTGNVIDNRTSDNSASTDLIVRSNNLVLWQATTGEKVRITSTGLVRIGGATENSADIDSTNTKLTIKQTANNQEDGIYIERSGERRGHYIYVGGALGQSDALCFTTNQLGTDTHILALDRSGDIITGTGNVGINEESPTNQLHISGTTNVHAGGLLRLNATTGDNFILFDNTNDSTEWAVGNDSGSRNDFRLYYNNGSGYTTQIVAIDGTHNNGKVTIDGGTNTLVNIRADSGGAAGLRLGGQAGSGTDQCTGYVEVHQDESHGGGIFYNGDGSPSFATGESADYFSLFRLSSGTRHSVMRWFHNSNDCNVQGNMYIDNGATSILRVTGDSSGTAGVSAGGDSSQTQCTGYLECHQDQIHGGGISYNGDGSPSFVNNETADHVTFYRMNSGTRERVFHYAYNSNTVNFRGTIQAAGANSTIKNFKIPHPHPSKKDTHDLIHSSIEGPQCDNIYRGKVDLVGGTATVNIDTVSNMTDGTFVLLNRDIQCFTSNETGWTNVKGSVTGNLLTIIAQDDTCTDTISWMVVGERQDEGLKSEEVDTTDTYGKLIVELPR